MRRPRTEVLASFSGAFEQGYGPMQQVLGALAQFSREAAVGSANAPMHVAQVDSGPMTWRALLVQPFVRLS